MRTGRRQVGMGVVAIAALVGAPAAGAATWSTGAPLSPANREAREPMVAMTPGGGRLVAWIQFAANGSSTEGLSVRSAAAGAEFGAIQTLPGQAFAPELTVGEDGTAVLVWGEGTTLAIARRAPGEATFTPATPLSLGGAFIRGTPRAVVRDGEAIVVAATRTSSGNLDTTGIRAARLAPGATALVPIPGAGPGGTLDEVTSASRVLETATVAVDGATIDVVWEDLTDSGSDTTPSTTVIRRATGTTAGMSAGAPLATVSWPSFRASSADAQIVRDGGPASVAWAEPPGRINIRDLATGGTRTLVTPSFPFPLMTGADRAGGVVLGHGGFDPATAGRWVFGATAPPGAEPAAEQLTAPGASRVLDDLATHPGGNALLVLERPFRGSAASVQVQASFRDAGGAFGALEEVSGPRERIGSDAFDRASGAVGSDGTAAVAWTADDGSGTPNQRVHLSERDPTVPPPPPQPPEPTPGGSGPPAGDPPPDTTAPTLSKLTSASRRFRVATGRTALIAQRRRARAGTTFKVTVSEPSTLVLQISRRRASRVAGTLVRAGLSQGRVRIPFTGRLERRRLAKGAYDLRVIAIDGAGNRSAPARTGFRVVAR